MLALAIIVVKSYTQLFEISNFYNIITFRKIFNFLIKIN